MKIDTSNITFQSKIRFIDAETFNRKVLEHGVAEIPYPWTIETMKVGKILYTKNIMECIAGFITNGKQAAGFHLGTRDEACAIRDKVKPFDINNIESVLSSKFDLNQSNLHGFLLGAWNSNVDKLKQIKSLLKKYKIPFSIFGNRKDTHIYGDYSLLYDVNEDTLSITQSLTKKWNKVDLEAKIRFSDDGKIEYTTYQKTFFNDILDYLDFRLKTGIEEFFKSEFKEVKLCDLDEWG